MHKTGGSNYVKIMGVRVVPDGDERDEDIANGIRYAVDNGAKILNMSFGKPVSPGKKQVWEALKYAESKGVLLVKAARNENEDIDLLGAAGLSDFHDCAHCVWPPVRTSGRQ